VPVVERGFFITGLMNDTNILVLHNIPLEISRRIFASICRKAVACCAVFWIEVVAIE